LRCAGPVKSSGTVTCPCFSRRYCRVRCMGTTVQGLHSSAFQLNLSRFWHKKPPKHPLILPHTLDTPPKQLPNAPPIAQKLLTLSRKVDECKPLPPCHQGPVL